MKTINFTELNNLDYNILRIVPSFQRWRDGDIWHSPSDGRPNSALMYFSNCSTKYTVNGKPGPSANKGDIAYLPYKSEYSCCFSGCGFDPQKGSSLILNFELYDDTNKPFVLDDSIRVFTPKPGSYYYESFRQVISLFYGSTASYTRIKALLYNLLTDISSELRREGIYSQRFAPIYRGIDYLEHNFTSDLSISSLAAMCHVSETCFRRLFKLYAGMPPKEYINHLRISKARILLESGAVSVSGASLALGFDDPSYFSRLYKKKTGSSPAADIAGRV